jgi:hypothetical protein
MLDCIHLYMSNLPISRQHKLQRGKIFKTNIPWHRKPNPKFRFQHRDRNRKSDFNIKIEIEISMFRLTEISISIFMSKSDFRLKNDFRGNARKDANHFLLHIGMNYVYLPVPNYN